MRARVLSHMRTSRACRLPYAPRTKFGLGPRELSKPTDTPAPGAYTQSVHAVRPRSAAWAFGSSGRFHGHTSEAPGPDAYGPLDKSALLTRAPHTKFGTSQRDGGHRDRAPGPQYDVDTPMRHTRPTSARTRIGTSPRFTAHKVSVPRALRATGRSIPQRLMSVCRTTCPGLETTACL